LLLATLCLTPPARAQSAGTGAVSGRVYNPETQEYVRNARIRVVSTGEVVVSEQGGFYQITNLAPGEVSLRLRYIGYPDVISKVTVAAGVTATLDFDLPASTATATAATTAAGTVIEGEIVQLEKFTVTSDRTGQAKAIMQQRASMDIGHVIASDVFGDDPEGNIGEFLRNVPGIMISTSSGEVTSVGLGGLSPEYTNVTVDGVALASADATAGANITRAPVLNMISLSSMESLEISRTISADVDANSPAGTINMRSKSAFDRRGTHFAARAVFSMHSTAPTLHKTLGPSDNDGSLKIRPGYIMVFSHSVKNKFGILLDINESNIYSETYRVTVSYNNSRPATDPRPQLPTALSFQQSPRINRRFAATFRTDWRPFHGLTVGLGVIYNYSNLWNPFRSLNFNTGITTSSGGRRPDTSTILLGDHPEYAFETTSPDARLMLQGYAVSRLGQTINLTPRFEYRVRDLVIDGMVAMADSKSWTESLSRHGAAYTLSSPTSYFNYRVTRSGNSGVATDYKITQLTGGKTSASSSASNLSLSDGAAFSKTTLLPYEDRESTVKAVNAQINASLMTRWLWPVNWKAGFKSREEKRTWDERWQLGRVSYNGANYAEFKSALPLDFGSLGVSIEPLNGGTLFIPSLEAIGTRYLEHREEFTRAPAADDYYNSLVYYHRNFRERIDAGYFMGTTTFLDKRLQVRAGIRWEGTLDELLKPDALLPAEFRELYPDLPFNNSTGHATTEEGVRKQFYSKPQVSHRTEYDHFFPSASLKYYFRDNFTLQLGMSSTIRRPNFSDLVGIPIVSDTNQTVSLSNIDLKPEKGRNFGARLAYYFRGVGSITVAAYQNHLKNMIQSERASGSEIGGDLGERYPGYDFSTRFNTEGTVRVRSLELGWSQNLGFIDPAFKRLSLRANYTRAYAEVTKSSLIPHSVNAGANYSYRGLSLWLNHNWTDDIPTSASGSHLRRHRSQTDFGGDIRLNRTYSISFSARNLFNQNYMYMQQIPSNARTLTDCLEIGTTYSFSIRGGW
jgi:TonB-dependent receptor